jgi:hypothetical protein
VPFDVVGGFQQNLSDIVDIGFAELLLFNVHLFAPCGRVPASSPPEQVDHREPAVQRSQQIDRRDERDHDTRGLPAEQAEAGENHRHPTGRSQPKPGLKWSASSLWQP